MMVCPSAHLQKGEFFMAKWFTVDHKVSFIFWVGSIIKSSFVKSYKGLVNSKLQAWTNEQRSLISGDQISSELGSKSLPVATCCWKGKKTIVDHRIPHNWMANWKLQILQLRDKSPFHCPPCPPVQLWPAHLQIWDRGSPPTSLFKLKAGIFWTVFHARVSVVWTHP